MLKGIRILIALALLQSIPAFACSVREGYRVPTNLELVQKADLIVLGKIVSGPDEASGLEPEVLIEPVRIFKGERPSGPLKVIGSVRWNGVDIPALPSSLATAHFSVGIGACVRVFYPKGGLVLAMFRKEPAIGAGLFQLFEPFARVVEDVEGPDGPWVKAVEAYLALVAGTPAGTLRQTAEANRDALRADRSSLAAQAIAADLDDYLRETGPKPWPPRKPRWELASLPTDAAALMMFPGAKDPAVLLCKSGARSMEVQLWGRRKGGQIDLIVGAQTFAAEGEAIGSEKIGGETKRMLAGTIDFTGTLSNALQTNVSDVGIRVDSRPGPTAPPLDALQKFALRCSALLRSKS
jgi:hypothetical protein